MTKDTPNTGVRQFWIVKWTSRPGAVTMFKVFEKLGTMLTYISFMKENPIPFQILYASTISMELRDVTSIMKTEAILHVPTHEELEEVGKEVNWKVKISDTQETTKETNEEHNTSKAD